MESSAPDPVLVVRGLRAVLSLEGRETVVFDAVDLTAREGRIVDIGGASGTGKTTLLRALARLLPGVTGGLSLKGVPAEQIDPSHWRARVALLPQKPAIVAGTVRDNLTLPWTLKVRSGIEPPTDADLSAALESVALGEVGLQRDAVRLSVGQQARVALLRVVLTAPDVLLLDEPDAALDETSAAAVRLAIGGFASGGGAVLRVRHRADDGLAHERLVLSGGRLEGVSA